MLAILLPIAVIILIWLPVVAYYSVPETSVGNNVVESARDDPSDAVLQEIAGFDLLPINGRSPEMEISVAEGILRGELALPGLTKAPIGLPFSPDDLQGLPAEVQLFFAGFAVPDFLIAAYLETGREEFFAMAHDVILAWDRYERWARMPSGYLLNDHAIAARVRVLGEFWRVYRHRPDYRPEEGRIVLEQAARYREMLADPGRFTFSTNHGLMQNLALLHVELAFPTLPHGDRYRLVALERLDQQLSFLMDEDGIIRENSSGYQGFGLEILGMTFRSMTMLGATVPEDWTEKYQRGLLYLARLERPDGTLPASGDTDGGPRHGFPRETHVDGLGVSSPLRTRAPTRPASAWSVYPSAGYSIEWDGLSDWPNPEALSQTVVTWTMPPALSHKHADELSVLVWSKGVSWLTSVGYWPYDAPGRAQAESWVSTNAPHLANEPTTSERTATLLSAGRAAELSALDLERQGPGTYVARRQIVHLKPDLWVIVDHVAADTSAGHETVWTLAPEVRARRDLTNSYALETMDDSAAARLTVVGSIGTEVREFRGSEAPFAGWQVRDSVPQAAPAIRVEQPAGTAWTVVVLSTAEPGSPQFYAGARPEMSAESRADAWTITLPLASGKLQLTRAGGRIEALQEDGAADATSVVDLARAPSALPARESVRAAFEAVASEYPVFQDRMSARTRVTGALVAVLLVQEAFAYVLRRGRAAFVVPIRILGLFCWIAIGALLHFHVLGAWSVIALPT